MIFKTCLSRVVLVFGASFSLVMVLMFPQGYHHYDLNTFWKWAYYWHASWRYIYFNCDSCNYPILGTFSSAGLMSLLSASGYEKSIFYFRLFLGVVDGVNVFLIYSILKTIRIENCAFWAGAIGISISSWAGGALWGQIDDIAQFFILLTFLWIVKQNLERKWSGEKFKLYLIVAGIVLACVLLVKQLTVFGVVSLLFVFFMNIFLFSGVSKESVFNALIFILFFVFSVLFFDVFLELKKPYVSHLYYVLKTGSGHSGQISGNGFNIWMFLGRDMKSSSHLPLFSSNLQSSRWLSFLTPYSAGIFLFLALNIIVMASIFLFFKNKSFFAERFLNREMVLNCFFYFSFVNLGFNIFITGTHERYLYHFYPYAVVFLLGLREYSKYSASRMMVLAFFGANLYGVFVLGILFEFLDQRVIWFYWLVAGFHVFFLAAFLFVFLRYQNFYSNVISFFRSVR